MYDRISDAARELNEQRERWLNPPEWIADWGRLIDARDKFADVPDVAQPPSPDQNVAQPPSAGRTPPGAAVPQHSPRALLRHSAIMAEAARDPRFKKRTLTHLYNERPTWLKLAHEKLDRAVLAAYAAVDPQGGWSEDWATLWTETGAGQPLPPDDPRTAERKEIDQRVLANLLRLNLVRARAQSEPETD